MRALPFFLVGCAVLALVAACGTTVGGSGSGATGTGGDTGVGGNSACLAFPSPAGFVESCATGGQVGVGGQAQAPECTRCKDDGGGHRYTSVCVGSECNCAYTQGKGKPDLTCACKMTNACIISSPTCCPLFN
jgi:hypothetical protein